jgi:hypothetical protein
MFSYSGSKYGEQTFSIEFKPSAIKLMSLSCVTEGLTLACLLVRFTNVASTDFPPVIDHFLSEATWHIKISIDQHFRKKP